MAMSWDQIRRSLVERGVMTEGGTTRKARGRSCPHCGAPVLAGLDDDRCAKEAVVDPTPVNALGEATALLQNRFTYSLRWADAYYLDPRDQWNIAASPAGTDPRIEIVVQHKCGTQLAATMHTISTVGPKIKEITGDEPPF